MDTKKFSIGSSNEENHNVNFGVNLEMIEKYPDEPVFHFDEYIVRVVVMEGVPWFAAKDVCDALGLSNSREAVSKLEEDEVSLVPIHTPGGVQKFQAVTESGMYMLIMNSRKPEAKRFRTWVTRDVLPSIRKTGQYSRIPNEIQKLPDLPELLRMAASAIERNAKLEAENRLMLPKAEFFDAVADSKSAIAIAEVARVLEFRVAKGKILGQNGMFDFLRKQKVLKSDNLPYQEFIDRGYFRVIEQKYSVPSGELRISFKTLVYQRGLDFIRQLLQKKLASGGQQDLLLLSD